MFAIDAIAEQSRQIGYRADAIVRDYTFSDVVDEQSVHKRQTPLAVFTQTPPSYRSAAFGVAENSRLGPEATAQQYRSLGAPLIFVVEGDFVSIWQIYGEGLPRKIQRSHINEIPNLFQANRDTWSPDAIHRAKSIGQLDANYQLDFVDVGLLPALEGEVHQKLDRLLRETLAATRQSSKHLNLQLLFQGVFRLLAAKVLIDRNHESVGRWDTSNVVSVLEGIGSYYGLSNASFNSAAVGRELETAWGYLSQGLNVANISADDLAFVYENTLVTPETRSEFGTHSTPRHVAEYIVRRLGIWRDPESLPRVFEPYTGAGVFLVSALRHMRESLPVSWSDRRRHDLLVQKICGVEVDSFACEVATLSLILADYPNTNGWKIENNDLYRDRLLYKYGSNADVILCNPPFEKFSAEQRIAYPEAAARSGSKAIAVLAEVLEAAPNALGFVLPRGFLFDRSYREYRDTIQRNYSDVELVSLPDGVFSVSQVETALLIAQDRKTARVSRKVRVLSSEVDDVDKQRFAVTGLPSRQREELRDIGGLDGRDLWISALSEIWKRMEDLPRLGDYAEGHWGIRWKKGGQAVAGSDKPSNYRQRGYLTAGKHAQYHMAQPSWVDVRPENLYAGGQLPWSAPKILCNSARLSRGYWRLAAAVDEKGCVASQQFVGLWPWSGKEDVDLYVLAAVLNGPVANAYITEHSSEKRFRIGTLLSIPFPETIPESVGDLAREYARLVQETEAFESQASLASNVLDAIDEQVLEAYDLPPRMIRSLLAAFKTSHRPVAHKWHAWGISESDPALTLAEIRADVLKDSRCDWVREKLVPVPSKEDAKALPYLP